MSMGISENLLRGVFLRAARGVLGVSLKDLGKQVGVTAGAVGKWENNEAPIKDSIFDDLKRFFQGNGVTFDDSNPEQLIIKVEKNALMLISDNPRNVKFQTLNDMVLAQAKSELHSLLNSMSPRGDNLGEQDQLLIALASVLGGRVLHIQPSQDSGEHSKEANAESQSDKHESSVEELSKDSKKGSKEE